MANALEELRRMRSETKSKETKLFPSRTYAGVMRIKDLEEGKSAFRIALHPKDNIPFVPLRTTYLEVEETIQNLGRYNMNRLIEERKLERALGVRKVEDLKEVSDDDLRIMLTDELGADFTMLVRKSIFISKFHGDRELPDIVEEYIRFANKMINDVCQDVEEQKKKRAPITGWKDKKTGQWNPGIMPSTNWVSYMFPIEQQSADLVRFEMYPAQMDDIEKLYQSFDTPDQPLTVDPFSDPEEGWPIEFDKGKDSKGKNVVTITEKKAPRTMTGSEFVAKYALTPSQIEELESKPSLTEMYVGVYSKRDYRLALNGLQIFDEKNELNVFENDEFLAIVEELTNHYANQGDNDDQKEQEQPKRATPAVKKSTPKKDDMDILDEKPGRVKEKEKAKTDRRQELTDAIKALDSRAKILPRHTVEDLEEWLAELQEEEKFANAESASSDDTDGIDDAGELPEPVKELPKSSVKETPKGNSLQSMRDRLKNRQQNRQQNQ